MAYDVKKLTVVVGGRVITGWAEGVVVSAEQMEDGFSEYTGADGLSEVAISSDKRVEVTLRLKSTSPSISYLNGLANSKREVAFSSIDANNNGTNVSGSRALVRRPVFPDRGREIAEAEFTVLVLDGTIQ